MEVPLSHTNRVLTLENLSLYHVGSYLPLGACSGHVLMAAEQVSLEVLPILVRHALLFSGTDIPPGRDILWTESC
jgi:hypothetical protein